MKNKGVLALALTLVMPALAVGTPPPTPPPSPTVDEGACCIQACDRGLIDNSPEQGGGAAVGALTQAKAKIEVIVVNMSSQKIAISSMKDVQDLKIGPITLFSSTSRYLTKGTQWIKAAANGSQVELRPEESVKYLADANSSLAFFQYNRERTQANAKGIFAGVGKLATAATTFCASKVAGAAAACSAVKSVKICNPGCRVPSESLQTLYEDRGEAQKKEPLVILIQDDETGAGSIKYGIIDYC